MDPSQFLQDYLLRSGNSFDDVLIADRDTRRPPVGSIPPGQYRHGQHWLRDEEGLLYREADPSIRLTGGKRPYNPTNVGGAEDDYDEYVRQGGVFPLHLGEIVPRFIQGIPFQVQKTIRNLRR